MKKIKFLATLLAAGALVACNETIEPQGSGENTPTTGEGYVKVAINMPTTSGDMTKVDNSGIFDDGLESEYAVKSAALVFFKASSTLSAGQTPESAATFVKAYDVTTSLAGEGGSDNQVTNRHIVLNEAPMAGDGEQIYALAILNYKGLFSIADGKLLKSNADVFGPNKTIKALQTETAVEVEELSDVDPDGGDNNGFLMTNSPLSIVPENLTDLKQVQTLVPVTVYAEQATAESSPAANIYVERAVAKVTLKGFQYTADDGYTAPVAESDTESPFTDDMVKLSGWTLNVTNKTTNVVRDISDIITWCSSKYCTDNRFLGQTRIDGNDLYRIYWGKDHNYSGEYNIEEAKDHFHIYSNNESANIQWNTNAEHDNSSYPLYCLENTMDYNRQNENQTTTLLLKTTYIADPSSDNQNFFMVGTTALTYSEEAFLLLVKTTLSLEEDVALSLTAGGGVYTLNGNKKIKGLLTVNDAAISDDQAQALYNNLGEIRFYKDGAAYYNTVLIRHFSDDYTDVVWDASKPTYGEKHLGRYGVLRNNWYEINITSISGPGDPEIIDPGTDPNDDDKGYIRAQINVLSWAKRSQDVDL